MKALTALFLVLVAALLFQKAILAGVNHDEQQFVAPPALLAHDGAMPYRDFALLHTPNLVFAYALLDRLTSWHFLAARLFNAACAWAVAALVYFTCHRLLASFRAWPRFALATGFTLLLVCSPLWMHTAARAWNHDSALLLVVIGSSRSSPRHAAKNGASGFSREDFASASRSAHG